MILVGILTLLICAVPLSALSNKCPKRLLPFLLPLPALTAFVGLLSISGTIVSKGAVSFNCQWVPQLGLDFALNLNGIGLFLALVVTGIGTLIMLYATGYMAHYTIANRLYAYLYAFMFAMVGLAMADHILLFFIAWELTSITSYLLIGFSHYNLDARKSALQALTITGLGGMALLAGFILIGGVTDTWHISKLIAERETILSSDLYPAMLILVLLGAFTKSAQFPFHFWLPNAMSAPTPVSAYLHSATMVKAGIFLMALMLPILGGTLLWTTLLTLFGGITLIIGGLFGLSHHDLKKILAGTTVAVLGLLTLLLGIGTEKAVLAALLFFLGHALYKATLFMVAGSIDHATGTRDSRLLGNLRTLMPWTAAAAGLAAFSKMGLPPFFGFLGKEYTYKAGLYADNHWAITTVLVLGNVLVFALAVKAGIFPFWRKQCGELPKAPHEIPVSMRIGPLLLASLGLIVGLFPQCVLPLLSAAKSAVVGYETVAEVKIWAGFNLPLALSGVTVALGLAAARFHKQIGTLLTSIKLPAASDIYDIVFNSILKLAYLQTRLLQSGYLRNYLLITIAATGFLVLLQLQRFTELTQLVWPVDFSPVAIVITLLMLCAIVLAVFTNSRLTALVALGVIGFGVAILFAIYSAPDLAITQILVETLTVVLFAWVVYKLPGFQKFSSKRTLIFDAIFSIMVGAVITIMLLKSKALEFAPSISEGLALASSPKAHGANVVNVILVDFRALDTWGEICVLAIAALGVWALLKKPLGTAKKGDL